MKKCIFLLALLIIPVIKTPSAPRPYINKPIEVPCSEVAVYAPWQKFIIDMLPFAKQIETMQGMDPLFILAQAALESGYGKHAPGNMYFGIKDHDGINGNEQLLKTHEIFNTPDKPLKHIIKIEQLPSGLYKYTIREYFRKYPTPLESFQDHAAYLNKRLKGEVCCDARTLAKKMAKIKYATAPGYSKILIKHINKIENFIKTYEGNTRQL